MATTTVPGADLPQDVPPDDQGDQGDQAGQTMPPVGGEGLVRTDVECTECHKGFIAELDFRIDGNHIIECPHCGHEHCRVIEQGKITADRWSSRMQRVDVEKRSVWKSNVLKARTTTASEFIRQSWLNRSDFQ